MADSKTTLHAHFEKVVTLADGPLERANFVLPYIEALPVRLTGRRLSDTSRDLGPAGESKPRGAPERLSDAARAVTKKLLFGKASLREWEAFLVYAGDTVKRASKSQRYLFSKSTKTEWDPTLSINESAKVADDWFLNHFLQRVRASADLKHSSAVVGNPGSGKSTLLKYLIVKHAEECRKRKIVFSRFEFLKFWNSWSNQGELRAALHHYMSYINLRDLLICHFLEYVDGRAKPRFEYTGKLDKVRSNTLAKKNDICGQAKALADAIGTPLPDTTLLLVENLIDCALIGHDELTNAIGVLPHKVRVVLIGVLSADYRLVTVFDGLDSVRIEDAFERTPQFEAVKKVIKTRRLITQFPELGTAGISMDSDSLTVMRNNTAAFLSYEMDAAGSDAQFAEYFPLVPVDPTAALVAAARRSATHVKELKDPRGVDGYVFDLVTILKRTMIAIARGHIGKPPAHLVYGLFDGNLRELFQFLEVVLEWQTREMIKGDYLDSVDYTTNNVPRLVGALASDRGNQLLRKKAYRMVELLLFREGDAFENVVEVIWSDDPLLGHGQKITALVENNRHTGQVDNVFNYLPSLEQGNLDQHGLLEKIRIMQLCEHSSLRPNDIRTQLNEVFGYSIPLSDISMSLNFMLKTNLLSATIEKEAGHVSSRLRTTNRGLLCLKALIFNLSYIEHIFHKTLLPESLVKTVRDMPRNSDLAGWVTGSIRNAYIFLAYVSFVEDHRASGRAVPLKYRISDQMRRGIAAAVDRITTHGSPEPVRAHGTTSSLSPELLATMAADEIAELLERWWRGRISNKA